MVNHPNRRRLWLTTSGNVCLREQDETGATVIREFWVPEGGGYVREVTARRPGTLGNQVCEMLAPRGATLWSDRDGLLELIRKEYRRGRAYERAHGF